jgi:hypothetical protein
MNTLKKNGIRKYYEGSEMARKDSVIENIIEDMIVETIEETREELLQRIKSLEEKMAEMENEKKRIIKKERPSVEWNIKDP